MNFVPITTYYTRVPNAILGDTRLSWKCKGIIAYLISKPSGWTARLRDIEKNAVDGYEAVRSGLLELRLFGYARQLIVADDKEMHCITHTISTYPIYGSDPEAVKMLIHDTTRKKPRHTRLTQTVFGAFEDIQKQCTALGKQMDGVYNHLEEKGIRTGKRIYDTEILDFILDFNNQRPDSSENAGLHGATPEKDEKGACTVQVEIFAPCNEDGVARCKRKKKEFLKKKDKERKKAAAPPLASSNFCEGGEGEGPAARLQPPASAGPQTLDASSAQGSTKRVDIKVNQGNDQEAFEGSHSNSPRNRIGLLGCRSEASQFPISKRKYSRIFPGIHLGYFDRRMRKILDAADRLYLKFDNEKQRRHVQHQVMIACRWAKARYEMGFPEPKITVKDLDHLMEHIMRECGEHTKGFWKSHFIGIAEAAWKKALTQNTSRYFWCVKKTRFLGEFSRNFQNIVYELQDNKVPIYMQVTGKDGVKAPREISDDIFNPRYPYLIRKIEEEWRKTQKESGK